MSASWVNPYIIVRVQEDGSIAVVHQTEKLKDARYWLTYISEPGDAIFTTPEYKQYKGDGSPTYMAHLLKRGDVKYDEKAWRAMVKKEAATLVIEATS